MMSALALAPHPAKTAAQMPAMLKNFRLFIRIAPPCPKDVLRHLEIYIFPSQSRLSWRRRRQGDERPEGEALRSCARSKSRPRAQRVAAKKEAEPCLRPSQMNVGWLRALNSRPPRS